MCTPRFRQSAIFICVFFSSVSAFRLGRLHGGASTDGIDAICLDSGGQNLLNVSIQRALTLPTIGRWGSRPNAYVKVSVIFEANGTKHDAQSSVVKENQNPEWNFECAFPAVNKNDATIMLDVMHHEKKLFGKSKESLIGRATSKVPYGTDQPNLRLKLAKDGVVSNITLFLSAVWKIEETNSPEPWQWQHVVALIVLGSACLLLVGFFIFRIYCLQKPNEDKVAEYPPLLGWHQVVDDVAPTNVQQHAAAPGAADVPSSWQTPSPHMPAGAERGWADLPPAWQTPLPPQPLGAEVQHVTVAHGNFGIQRQN